MEPHHHPDLSLLFLFFSPQGGPRLSSPTSNPTPKSRRRHQSFRGPFLCRPRLSFLAPSTSRFIELNADAAHANCFPSSPLPLSFSARVPEICASKFAPPIPRPSTASVGYKSRGGHQRAVSVEHQSSHRRSFASVSHCRRNRLPRRPPTMPTSSACRSAPRRLQPRRRQPPERHLRRWPSMPPPFPSSPAAATENSSKSLPWQRFLPGVIDWSLGPTWLNPERPPWSRG